MCFFKTVPGRKDISSDLREATTAAQKSGKSYKVISKQICFHHLMRERSLTSGKHSRHLPVFPGVLPQDQTVQRLENLQNKSYISKSKGFCYYVKVHDNIIRTRWFVWEGFQKASSV